jgi:hypothetical protein
MFLSVLFFRHFSFIQFDLSPFSPLAKRAQPKSFGVARGNRKCRVIIEKLEVPHEEKLMNYERRGRNKTKQKTSHVAGQQTALNMEATKGSQKK